MWFLFWDVFRSKLLEELRRSPWNQISPACFVALHCLESVILTKRVEWCFSKSQDLGHFGSCCNLNSGRRACDTVVTQHTLAYTLSCPSHWTFSCPLSVRKSRCTLLCWPQSFYFSQISPVLVLIVHLNPQVSELPLSLQTGLLHPASVFCISRHIPWAALKHIWVSWAPEHCRRQGPAKARLLLTSALCGRVSLRRPKLKFDYKQSRQRAMVMNHSYWSVLFPKMRAASLLRKEPWLQRTKEAVSSLKVLPHIC